MNLSIKVENILEKSSKVAQSQLLTIFENSLLVYEIIVAMTPW